MKATALSTLLVSLLIGIQQHSFASDEVSDFPTMQRDSVGIGKIEQGKVSLPSPELAKKVWIGFLAKDGLVSRETTNRLQETLEKAGFKVTNNRDLANIKITVSGVARIRNEMKNSFDTGNVLIKEIAPTLQMDTIVYGNSTPDFHANRGLDAGIIQGSNSAISQTGVSTGGGLAGLGVAVGINLLRDIFESSPEVKNKPFQNIVGDKGDRPFICFDACRKTHHEVILNVTSSSSENPEIATNYSIYVDKLGTSVDEKGMGAIASIALEATIKQLTPNHQTADANPHE